MTALELRSDLTSGLPICFLRRVGLEAEGNQRQQTIRRLRAVEAQKVEVAVVALSAYLDLIWQATKWLPLPMAAETSSACQISHLPFACRARAKCLLLSERQHAQAERLVVVAVLPACRFLGLASAVGGQKLYQGPCWD